MMSAANRTGAPIHNAHLDKGRSRGLRSSVDRDHDQEEHAHVSQRAGFVEKALSTAIDSRIEPDELRSVAGRRGKLVVEIETGERRGKHTEPIETPRAAEGWSARCQRGTYARNRRIRTPRFRIAARASDCRRRRAARNRTPPAPSCEQHRKNTASANVSNSRCGRHSVSRSMPQSRPSAAKATPT